MFARLIIFIVFCVWFITVTYGLFDIVLRVKKIEEDVKWLIDEHDRHNNYIHILCSFFLFVGAGTALILSLYPLALSSSMSSSASLGYQTYLV